MKTRDTGKKVFKKALQELGKHVIQIGAVGEHDPKKEGGETIHNNELLAIHEFTDYGAGPRAPISKTVLNKNFQNVFSRTMQNLLQANYKDGKIKLDQVLNGLGLFTRQKIKATILQGVTPDILPETKKASKDTRVADVPLIDTRQMFDGIEYGIKRVA
jgi:hypothetical protein